MYCTSGTCSVESLSVHNTEMEAVTQKSGDVSP